jgi:hypothetical protein
MVMPEIDERRAALETTIPELMEKLRERLRLGGRDSLLIQALGFVFVTKQFLKASAHEEIQLQQTVAFNSESQTTNRRSHPRLDEGPHRNFLN